MKFKRIFLYSAVPLAALALLSLFAATPVGAQGLVEHIAPETTGTLGANGWYVSDVIVAWDNPPPGATGIVGCQNSVITSDSGGVEEVCTYYFDGTTYIGVVEIKRDTTPPEPGCNIQPRATYPMTEGEEPEPGLLCLDGQPFRCAGLF